MIIAFVVPGTGGRDVTRAKKFMSALMRGQGRVPLSPMPRRVGSFASCGVRVDAMRIGVAATIRVRGRVCGRVWFVAGGMLGDFAVLLWALGLGLY